MSDFFGYVFVIAGLTIIGYLCYHAWGLTGALIYSAVVCLAVGSSMFNDGTKKD